MTFILLRLIRNTYGAARGHSGCEHCGDSWSWKKGHSIYYNRGSAMFPVCEECWKRIGMDEKEHYIKKTVSEWRAENDRHPTECSPRGTLNGQPFEEILANALLAIEWERFGVNSHHLFNSEPRLTQFMDGAMGFSYCSCPDRTCAWHVRDKRFVWTGNKGGWQLDFSKVDEKGKLKKVDEK